MRTALVYREANERLFVGLCSQIKIMITSRDCLSLALHICIDNIKSYEGFVQKTNEKSFAVEKSTCQQLVFTTKE